MPLQTWQETLIQAQTDGAALTNSTTETSILPGQAKFTLPANFLDYVGKTLRIRASGRISTLVTSPGTMTFKVKFGSIAVATGPAFALNAVAKTNVTWWLEWALTARTIGAATTATFMHTGQWTSEAIIGSPVPGTGGSGTLLIPASAPAVGTGFDSTSANVVDLTATWSVANAANSILLHQYACESIN